MANQKQFPINGLSKVILACIDAFGHDKQVAILVYNILDICKDRNEEDINVVISTVSKEFNLDKLNFPLYSVEKINE